MSGKRKGHVFATPIKATAAPFLGSRSLGLRRLTVVKEKTRIAFKGMQLSVMRKYYRSAYKAARPVIVPFNSLSVKKCKIFSRFRLVNVVERSMKVAAVGNRSSQWFIPDLVIYFDTIRFDASKFEF